MFLFIAVVSLLYVDPCQPPKKKRKKNKKIKMVRLVYREGDML